MVAIIDYDAGNIRSVEKAIISLGYEAVVTRDADTILGADHVISVSYTHLDVYKRQFLYCCMTELWGRMEEAWTGRGETGASGPGEGLEKPSCGPNP